LVRARPGSALFPYTTLFRSVTGLALFFALQCWLFRRFLAGPPPRNTPGAPRDGPEPSSAWTAIGFAALWVAFEWLRGWLLTGFPWLYLGYAHIHTPLGGFAPVTGVLGIGFAVVLSAALLHHAWHLATHARGSRRLAPPLLGIAALWGLGALLATVDWVAPRQAPPLRVALVQANVDQDLKFDPAYLRD